MGEVRELFCFSLLFVFSTVFIQLKSCGAQVHVGDTLSFNTSISGNQTIISKNGTFELGFFSPTGTSNSYIGIWYANLTEQTVVWVANRENPARNRKGVLKLSGGGDLGLFDATGASLWSVNVTKKPSYAVILDTGNFVVFSDDNNSEIVWQSFDNPTDTWLPGMRFGGQQKLVCWKNSIDPAPGLFSLQADPSGAKQFVLTWNNSVQYWASGNWEGNYFSQVPEMTNRGFYNLSVEDTGSGLYITYSLTNMKNSLSRFVVVKSGELQQFVILTEGTWNMFWSQPRDQCDVYALCGAYGSNYSNNLQFCSCVDGFTPKDNRSWNSRESWSSGCIRESSLNCNPKNGSTDIFLEPSVTLPDTNSASSVHPAITTQKDCEKACLLNCSCTAYAFKSPSGPCQIWSGDLLNIQRSESKSSSNVFIRVSASTLLPKSESTHSSKPITMSSTVGAVVGTVAALAVAIAILSVIIWSRHIRQTHRVQSITRRPDTYESFIRMFSYIELKIATRNFRCKLGSGGFGTVFKGQLIDGTLVAVKKMENCSRRDEKQFRAEISCLGKIQHVNLIRLRGFCAKGSKRFLIYDYMPNGSLNSLLFARNGKLREKVLDWKTRFEIVKGTARGLAYLHEECRDFIIHGDIKPENILLDTDLSPKLADFGLAKIVGRELSRVVTTTRGTRGYLAPEWISGVPITPKVDVYSFGVTVLEIISGRRSIDFNVQDSSQYYFPAWAATQICNGNTNNIVEEGIAEDRDIEEVRRAIYVGLLCIEKEEQMRPSMRQVLLFLQGKIELQIQSALLTDRNAAQSSTDSDTDSHSDSDGDG